MAIDRGQVLRGVGQNRQVLGQTLGARARYRVW